MLRSIQNNNGQVTLAGFPIISVLAFPISVVIFTIASYYMSRDWLIWLLRVIADYWYIVNCIMVTVGIVFSIQGTRLDNPQMTARGLRYLTCLLTLSASAGVIVIVGSAQRSVDPALLQDLYAMEFILLTSYTIVAIGHGVIHYYHQKSSKPARQNQVSPGGLS